MRRAILRKPCTAILSVRLSCRLPRLVHPCQLMTARTRRVSETIIEVEAKSVDDSACEGRSQAGLLIAGRDPAVEEEVHQKVSATFRLPAGLEGIVGLRAVSRNAGRSVHGSGLLLPRRCYRRDMRRGVAVASGLSRRDPDGFVVGTPSDMCTCVSWCELL